MESSMTDATGVRRDVFNIKHNQVDLTVINKTSFKQLSKPRRGVLKELTSKILYKTISLIELNEHVRPGQTYIPQLSWLKGPEQLKDIYKEDFVKKLTEYCSGPVEFLVDDHPVFMELMEDPWCFDTEEFSNSAQDFYQAYNKYNKTEIPQEELQLQVERLDKIWNCSFNPDTSLEALVASGFLDIPEYLLR